MRLGALAFCAVVLTASGTPASAQSTGAQRWTRTGRGTPTVVLDRWVSAVVVDAGRVHVRVTRLVNEVDQITFQQTVDGPHWRSPVGEQCQAMGVAGADFVRLRGRIAVRVQVSVSDLCETRALAYTIIALPQPVP